MCPLLTILLVEDSPAMRRVVRHMLERGGLIQVLEAGDGRQALAILRHHRVDLVVSDLHMAPMDGHVLMDTLRADPDLADIPFVLMTSRHSPEVIAHTVRHRLGAYLAKPFERDQLLAVLDRLINAA